jgi:hypothetical protein
MVAVTIAIVHEQPVQAVMRLYGGDAYYLERHHDAYLVLVEVSRCAQGVGRRYLGAD